MAVALAARGHRVTLACGRYAGAETGLGERVGGGRRRGPVPGGFEVVEFPIAYGNDQSLPRRAAAFLRYAIAATHLALREGPDVVLASSTPLTVALPALAARRLARIPFVFEIRDPWPELPRALSEAWPDGAVPGPVLRAMDRLADAACRHAAAVVALTEGMAETAVAHGADPARVHVVPNGCDLGLFGPQIPSWRPAMAQSWEMLATYAGAHGRANGLDALLDAAAALRDRGERRVRIVLVGEGGEKPRLVVEARRRGLENVTFLDPLPKPAIAALLAGSGVALHCLAPIPGFAEWTAPNKLMDGLAAGRPVVTNVPGRAARIVEDGPSGIAVPPGDAGALAAALAGLAADPARRAAMGRAARAQAVTRWDRRLQAARLCRVVEGVARPAARDSVASRVSADGPRA
ncbi:glycosyltransferase family 4 protein [Roseomonas sp. CCTCC AB2023176]|uniref:glycosyltransferase family 4 protein n=1 Tax=Roseomonas sp. CCTCC AB2023176 TaxID=3342640 RepID=UPI0035E2D2CE